VIKVLIAEDQAMVLGALSTLLDLETDIDVVGRAADGAEALRLAERLQPDVVLTDIEMPNTTGLELAHALKGKARVIILTTFARSGYLRRALDAGVLGYLLKDSPSDELAEAVRTVHGGQRAISADLAAEAWSEDDPLTDRERQVLKLAGDGASGAQISEALHLSEGTVRNYLSEAIGKLGAANRVEAARIARAKGWL
jgi:two-component system, NarL family, response regulator DesR